MKICNDFLLQLVSDCNELIASSNESLVPTLVGYCGLEVVIYFDLSGYFSKGISLDERQHIHTRIMEDLEQNKVDLVVMIYEAKARIAKKTASIFNVPLYRKDLSLVIHIQTVQEHVFMTIPIETSVLGGSRQLNLAKLTHNYHTHTDLFFFSKPHTSIQA